MNTVEAHQQDAGEAAEKRRGQDRRRTPYLLSDWRYAFGGQRRGARRDDDPGALHTDWYPSSLLVAALAVVVLSAFDATLTLQLMQRGVVTEANPLMATLIGHDVRLFVGAKTLITAVGVVLLVVYARLRLFQRLTMESIGWYLAGFYTLLVGYEFSLLLASR